MNADAVVRALSEPAAVLNGQSVQANSAWTAAGLPVTAASARSEFPAATAARGLVRIEAKWGQLEFNDLDGGRLMRLVRSAEPDSILDREEYRAVFEVTTDGLFVYDDNYALVDLNPAACRLHGWTREEMLAKHPSEFIHESSHHVFQAFVETLATQPSFRGVAQGLRSDGGTFDVEVYGVPLTIRGQRFYLGSVRDISHLKEALRNLELSESRMRRALEGAGAAYWEATVDDKKLFTSETYEAAYGGRFDSLEGWLQFGHPDDAARLREAWTRYLEGDGPPIQIERRVGADGEERWLQESAFVFERHTDGRPRRVAGSAIDITVRKLMEQRLLRGSRLESLGRMAGGIAHDFNNLLTVILSGAELVQADVPEDSLATDDIQLVIDSAERARRLTDQLLAFSRNKVIAPQVIAPGEHLEGMAELLRKLLGQGIELELEIAPDLYAIDLAATQLEQVLVNFTVNALHAMPNGGRFIIEADNVFLDRSFAASRPGVEVGHYVRLSITDTGVGMSPEVKDRIFEPFFTTKERTRGTGLGLATVYGIIQQHGGHVWVYSELGQGTSFRVYLPHADGALSPAVTKDVEEPIELGGSETLLVVDDDPDVLAIATQAFQRAGYQVVAAESGQAAIDLFAKHRDEIALVTTDVMLGDMNGRELADALNAQRPDLPVLFVSGYTENTIVKGGVLKEGVEFLPKPYSSAELLRAVRRILIRTAT